MVSVEPRLSSLLSPLLIRQQGRRGEDHFSTSSIFFLVGGLGSVNDQTIWNQPLVYTRPLKSCNFPLPQCKKKYRRVSSFVPSQRCDLFGGFKPLCSLGKGFETRTMYCWHTIGQTKNMVQLNHSDAYCSFTIYISVLFFFKYYSHVFYVLFVLWNSSITSSFCSQILFSFLTAE